MSNPTQSNPDPAPLHGGCACKSIRYTVTPEPYNSSDFSLNPTGPTIFPAIDVCHCQTCRSVTSAVFNTWYGIPETWVLFTLRNVSGNPDQDIMEVEAQDLLNQYLFSNPAHPKEPKEPVKYPESSLTYYSTSPGVLRAFCGKCGTAVLFVATGDVQGSVESGEWKVRNCVHLPWATLDQKHYGEERMKPKEHCWGGEMVGWVKEAIEGGDWGTIKEKW